jgi:hypothetical protein
MGVYPKKSKTDSVRSPDYVLRYVENTWGTFFDPVPFCPDFDPERDPDALKICWKGVNYVNPPFSCPRKFLEKGHFLWKSQQLVSIFLAKTDILGSQYFHKLIGDAELRFFNHHITFPGYDKRAPFPCMLVIFDGKRPGMFGSCDGRELM